MNRAERRAMRSLSRKLAQDRPPRLTETPREDWPPDRGNGYRPLRCWQSNRYLVQMFDAGEASAALYRLSVCRVTSNADGRWDDGITWQELDDIKREIGFGDSYAVEVYPRDVDVVNVANMRHLWICAQPLQIGWFSLL